MSVTLAHPFRCPTSTAGGLRAWPGWVAAVVAQAALAELDAAIRDAEV